MQLAENTDQTTRAVQTKEDEAQAKAKPRYNIDTSVLDELDRMDDMAAMPHFRSVIFMAAVFIILNIAAVIYVKASRYVYFGEGALCWNTARSIAEGNFGESFLKAAYNAVNGGECFAAALIPALTARIFSPSRLCFILTTVNCYLFPSLVCLYLLVRRHTKNPILMCIIVMLACPLLIYSTFAGFIDAAPIALCFVCYMLYFAKRPAMPQLRDRRLKKLPERSISARRYAGIGLCLAGIILLRRYYIYFAVSFIIAMLAEDIICGRRIKYTLIPALITGAVICCFPGLVSSDFVAKPPASAVTGAAELFAGCYGMAFLAAEVIMSVYMYFRRKNAGILTLWIQLLVCFAMFTFSSGHEVQHMLVYAPPMMMIMIIFLGYTQEIPPRIPAQYTRRRAAAKKPAGKIFKQACALGVGVLALCTFCSVCISETEALYVPSLFPGFSLKAPTRDDMTELAELKRYLNSTVGDDETAGVLAASQTLNADIVKNVGASLNITDRDPDYIVTVPTLDSANSDTELIYKPDYLVVAYPAQLNPSGAPQKRLTEAVTSFERYADIAVAYSCTEKSFTLENGVEVYVYKRLRSPDPVEISDFKKRIS